MGLLCFLRAARVKGLKAFPTPSKRILTLVSYVPIIILSGKSGNYQLLNEGLSMRNVEAKT